MAWSACRLTGSYQDAKICFQEASIKPYRQPRFWLLILLAMLQTGCAGCRKDGGDPRSLLPSDSRMVVVVESVADFQKPLAEFLSGIEGSKGLYELIDVQLGLDLTDEDGLEAVGLDKKTGLVFFEKDGALSLAVGVSYPERFLENVRKRIRILGPSTLSRSSNNSLDLVTGPKLPEGDGVEWSAAWGVTADNIGVVTWVGPGGDAEESWKAASEKPGDVFAKPSELGNTLLWAAGETQGVDLNIPVPMVGKMLSSVLQGSGHWTLGVEADSDTLRLRAQLPGGKGLGAIAPYMQTKNKGMDFSSLFPKNSSLLVRSRLLMEKAGPLLSGAALMLGGEPTYIDRLPLPPISMLLDSLTGEFAVAVMGLDDGVRPTTILLQVGDLPRLLQSVHTAVAVEARTEELAKALLKNVTDRAPAAGFKTTTIAHAKMQGVILTKEYSSRRRKENRVYTFLRKDRALIVLTGQGELQRFLDVQDGQAIPLSSAATDDHMKSVLSDSRDAVTLNLMSTRITRELADKGVPPFFLTVVNSIREVALRARVEQQTLNLVLEARQ